MQENNMTIQHAIDFIRSGQNDPQLRHRLVQADTEQVREAVLSKENFKFSMAEFEEAYSLTLFKCQHQKDAEALMTFRMWWLMLQRSPDKPLNT